MKRVFLLLLLCLWSSLSRSQDMARVRQTIDTLASPFMHGRGYIYQGDAKAAAYLRNRFVALGLQPLDSSYFQHFRMPVNRILATPQLQVDGQALVPGQDFVAQAATGSGAGRARVLPLDTLVFSDTTVAQKFFAQSFKNKAIVYAQKHARRLHLLPKPFQRQLNQARLHVILQSGPLLTTVTRQQQPVPVLEVLQKAWPGKAKKVTYSVEADLSPQHQTQNVIAFVKGSVQPDSFLVFTAHYDHLGGQGKNLYFPGANDNASGTAMLLELAAYYSRPQHRPSYSMAFMAFAAEEAGLLGSFYYVQHPLFPLQKIRFLVNLDLLGTGEAGLMVVNGRVHEHEFKLLQKLNEQHNYLSQLKSRGKAANSDHYPFSEAGVPAFFLYTLGGTSAYHHTDDHPRQLPLTHFAAVFQLLTDFAAALQQ